ncbi:hypothetical protein QBC37DRAFT_368864 [Rhypophila decipiens]|uniref:Uncharacterized protein n=1 Tax=Rhypophila decipiens TaxID=261697 RepID=A0AAN6YLW7_9PEZI|nr:hypothetical protein QBC37DRAFT_368864 [Rhypophila decipiens]
MGAKRVNRDESSSPPRTRSVRSNTEEQNETSDTFTKRARVTDRAESGIGDRAGGLACTPEPANTDDVPASEQYFPDEHILIIALGARYYSSDDGEDDADEDEDEDAVVFDDDEDDLAWDDTYHHRLTDPIRRLAYTTYALDIMTVNNILHSTARCARDEEGKYTRHSVLNPYYPHSCGPPITGILLIDGFIPHHINANPHIKELWESIIRFAHARKCRVVLAPSYPYPMPREIIRVYTFFAMADDDNMYDADDAPDDKNPALAWLGYLPLKCNMEATSLHNVKDEAIVYSICPIEEDEESKLEDLDEEDEKIDRMTVEDEESEEPESPELGSGQQGVEVKMEREEETKKMDIEQDEEVEIMTQGLRDLSVKPPAEDNRDDDDDDDVDPYIGNGYYGDGPDDDDPIDYYYGNGPNNHDNYHEGPNDDDDDDEDDDDYDRQMPPVACAFSKMYRSDGWFGYVGDVNMEPGSLLLVLAMLGLKTDRVTPADGLFGERADVEDATLGLGRMSISRE